ncbi:hypothetical protein SISSUDRAFT_1052399 [Sistotremastrum suecicum HHB10207 ss-3]|uniref:Activator of Hsp90 ATPase AHSA1-like N-terminal domain-containing protein n=1 Tax=Sistotremastrum suecicum HHB10207 ss-3 TaxID=1314776 RepID=A0A165ZWJ4_9AGAM|nr:hypothetical protein SISSUDRAFT_1052399 [Sistotremastrum suecicum HHB10207 ss-3]
MSSPNWHWKSKHVTPWAKSWFERELTTIIIEEGDEKVSVAQVTDVDGDVELGQRKSKLITIYDCKVVLEWVGTASDGSEVKGTLTIPEVSHEITLDGLSDYVYEWALTTASSPAVDAVYSLAKKRLPAALETKFAEFPVVLTDTHGKDITVSTANSTEPSRVSTPSIPSGIKPAVPAVKKVEKAINTATIKVECSFMASADDLFSLLTDEKRIPSWTRAPAQSNPTPGAKFSLFGGGVTGTYQSLQSPKEFVQTWALSNPNWPSGHDATLTTTLDQSSDSTKITWNLVGVPKGQEDETERNIQGYYVGGLKSIGYVPVFIETRSTPSSRPSPPSKPAPDFSRQLVAGLVALMALVAAVIIPYFSI